VGATELLPLHDHARLRPSIPAPLSRQLAMTVARQPSLPILLAERHRGRGRDHLYLAVSGVWLHLRFRLAVVEPAVPRPTATGVLTPAGAALRPLVSEFPARGPPARYCKMQAAAAPVRDHFLPSPAPFCGASSARSSICASLACNTPAASRATYAVTRVPSLTAHLTLDRSRFETSRLWKTLDLDGLQCHDEPTLSRPGLLRSPSLTMSLCRSRPKSRARNI
jgi:hypothetical protein